MSMSFRLRTFLASAAMVMAVLAAVLAVGWMRVMAFEVERLDVRLCSEARRLAFEQFPATHLGRLEADIRGKLHLERPEHLLLEFRRTEGDMGFRSPRWPEIVRPAAELTWAPERDDARAKVPRADAAPPKSANTLLCELASFSAQGQDWRMARADKDAAVGTVAVNLQAPRTEIRNALLSALLFEAPLALVLAGLGGWLLSSFTLRPVNRMREAMRAMAPALLDQRLREQGEDHEFAELIRAYNAMLERLERSFQQASRFSADAAHELKTPLTVLRGRIEQARRKATHDDLRADLSELLDEVGRLSAITRKLLLLAHADAGKLELHLEQVDLTALLLDVTADVPLMVEDRELVFAIAPGLCVRADATLLRQLLNNLMSNAARYSVAGGCIAVRAARSAAQVEVDFRNTSRTIPAAERAHFFERFYRGDAARNRTVEGHGLGLSLALEIARAHAGQLVLLPSDDTEVHLRLTLPAE